jgi:hypothetical protein
VNRAFPERSFVSESGKAVKPGSGQTGEHGSRASPEQRGSENLPVSKRAGMGDHHAAGRFLPASGGYLPSQLVFRHEPKRIGSADHTFVICENVNETRRA